MTNFQKVQNRARQLYKKMASRPGLIPLAGATAALLIVFLLYAPLFAQVWGFQGDYRRQRIEQQDARLLMDRLRAGQIKALPPLQGMPEVLEQLGNLARSHQIQFLSVTPGPPRPGGMAGLAVVPVEFQMEGGYRALGAFLGALRGAPSLGAPCVRSLTISRDEALLPRVRARLSIDFPFSEAAGGSPQ